MRPKTDFNSDPYLSSQGEQAKNNSRLKERGWEVRRGEGVKTTEAKGARIFHFSFLPSFFL